MEIVKQFFKDVVNIAYTRKFWTAALGFVLLWLAENLNDRAWVQAVITVATLLGVYQVPNAKK